MRKRILACFLAFILLMSLCACNSSNYKKANEYMNNGEYNIAVEAFVELGDYKDSVNLLNECRCLLAEIYISEDEYQMASDLISEINLENLDVPEETEELLIELSTYSEQVIEYFHNYALIQHVILSYDESDKWLSAYKEAIHYTGENAVKDVYTESNTRRNELNAILYKCEGVQAELETYAYFYPKYSDNINFYARLIKVYVDDLQDEINNFRELIFTTPTLVQLEESQNRVENIIKSYSELLIKIAESYK